jgi:hypothetical protein
MPNHFTTADLHAFEIFQRTNRLGLSIEVVASPGDPDTAFVDRNGAYFLGFQPTEGGFAVEFIPGEPPLNIGGAFSTDFVSWTPWTRTYATIESTLEAVETFIGSLATHQVALQAIMDQWSGNDGGDGGLRLAA